PDHMMERGLTNYDHPIERFLFNRAHKPFAVRVQIRTPRGQYHWLHTIGTQVLVEHLRQFGVPVMNERALAQEKPLKMLCELTSAGLQEAGGGMGCEPANPHPPRV